MAGVKTEKEFYSLYPDEASFFAAFPEAQEMKKGGNVPTNPQLYSRVKSEAKQKFDRWPCVPVSTSKALTKEGWKSYFELEVGELILAYDMKTKTNKWTPVLNLHYYENAPTIDIIKPGHNIKLTSTPDHKWVVYRKATGPDLVVHKNAELVYSLIQKLKNKEITFTEAKEYQSSIQEHYKKYKDCTWEEFLSESKFSKGGEFLITTEELKNGAFKQYVIKNAAPLDESYSDSNLKLTSKYNDSWTANVLDMSRSQSEVWFSSAIIYDGNQNKDYEVNSNGSKTYKTYGFKQKHPDHQDAFVASCILTGRRVRYGSYSENGCRNFYITERDYIPLDTVYFNDGESTDVWCPETEFGTWVMNQDGLVTITGNSAYGSAWLVKTYKSRGGGYRKAGYGMEMQDGGISMPAMMNAANYADAIDQYTGTNPFQTFAQGANLINAMQPQESEGNQSEIAGLAMQALPALMGMAEGGKMPAWLAKKRFAAAGNTDQLSSYGYAKRGGDIMIPMMMGKGGQPCYECGGSVKRMDEGGEPDGEMALGQIMAMHERLSNLQKFIKEDTDLEPWVSSKITLADDYLNAVSDYLQYGEDNSEYGLEAEQEEDYNMGEMEEMKNGGIPQRYKNMGFSKVGVKKKSTRPGKKWMVLAKKGDKYKVVHGGFKGMKDFSQHGSEKRKDNFWNRMGGKNSAKATDPFSPLYWHKRFGTWQEGGAIPSMDYDFMKQGGIYINPANKGKFTESANRAGMGVQEFARHVLANKEDYSATQVKRANFARNAAKWKKQFGGQDSASVVNTFMSPSAKQDPVFTEWANQQQQALRRSGVSKMPSQNEMWSYYSKNKPTVGMDQYGNYMFSNAPSKIQGPGVGYTQQVDPVTGRVIGDPSLNRRVFEKYMGDNFQMGGQIGLGDTMELDESEVQRLMDMGYGVEYIS